MKVDIAFLPYELGKKDLSGKSLVVIDALRATSTMITAFENGAAAFIPVTTVEKARAIAAQNPEFLLAGERRALPPEGFQLGNSPRDYLPEKVRGKTIVLTTTNGTQALVAAQGGAEIYIGSFLNIKAVCRQLVKAGRDVLIACSGEKGLFSLEDAVCGGAIVSGVEKIGLSLDETDAANAAKILYRHFANDICGMLFASEWGQHLQNMGLGEDIHACALNDTSDFVPVYREGKIFVEL
jgi:2-phosphosulfolactate phosphatase